MIKVDHLVLDNKLVHSFFCFSSLRPFLLFSALLSCLKFLCGVESSKPLLAISPVYGFVLIEIILERDKKVGTGESQRDKREWKDDVIILQSQKSMLKSVPCF